MQRKYDIVIEGNNLTSSFLAFFLSQKYKEEKKIALVYNESTTLSPLLFSGIFAPVFEFQEKVIEKVFIESKELLENLSTVTTSLELSNNPLFFLYTGKSITEYYEKHKEQLKATSIKFSECSLRDIQEYYPYFSPEQNVLALEIANSFSCSELHQLKNYLLKIASENEVDIIQTQDLTYSSESQLLKSTEHTFESSLLTILTEVPQKLFSDSLSAKIVKLITPIIEKFPRISVINLATQTHIWLEKGGYLNILKVEESPTKQSEIVKSISKETKELFSFLSKLQIIDIISETVIFSEKTKKVNIEWLKEKTLLVHVPLQLELSVVPALAKALVDRLEEVLKEQSESVSLESLFE
ncbi:MAG: hypothetical protein ACTSSG_09060 [Candidatus Heimdallarchaeaceae archaeon]